MIWEALSNLVFQPPLTDLIDTSKSIRFINNGMGRSQEESQGTLPNKVENFKGLLRNEVNKADIERGTKRKRKGKSHGTCPSRVEIFRCLLRNGTNKTDMDGVKTKFLIQHYLELSGPKDPLHFPHY